MSPGFAYEDYESGTRALVDAHPEQAERIRSLLIERA